MLSNNSPNSAFLSMSSAEEEKEGGGEGKEREREISTLTKLAAIHINFLYGLISGCRGADL